MKQEAFPKLKKKLLNKLTKNSILKFFVSLNFFYIHYFTDIKFSNANSFIDSKTIFWSQKIPKLKCMFHAVSQDDTLHLVLLQ